MVSCPPQQGLAAKLGTADRPEWGWSQRLPLSSLWGVQPRVV